MVIPTVAHPHHRELLQSSGKEQTLQRMMPSAKRPALSERTIIETKNRLVMPWAKEGWRWEGRCGYERATRGSLW